MARTVFVYFNEKDFADLMELLDGMDADYYDSKKNQVNALPYMSDGPSTYTICFGEVANVEFSPCFALAGYLQHGSFRLKDDSNSASRKKYSAIKSFIKKNYTYSKENSCYFGASFYNDWINYTCSLPLPILLESEHLDVGVEEIESLFEYVEADGFVVKPTGVRLRDRDTLNMTFDSFVVYSNQADVIVKIARKSFIHYLFDSKCLFVYKNTNRNTFSFVLDARIRKDPSTRMVELFDSLKDKFATSSVKK